MATYVPDSYLRAEAALNEITDQVARALVRKDGAVSQIKAVETELQSLTQAAPTGWAGLVQYINQQAAANPGDDQWKDIKGRKDKIVQDFQAARVNITAILTAIEGA